MLLNTCGVEEQPGHPFIVPAIEDVTEKNREAVA
jgi:hypothetical protein